MTWAIVGASATGYSPSEDAISRLADSGEPTQVAMTAGFVVYGASF